MGGTDRLIDALFKMHWRVRGVALEGVYVVTKLRPRI
ncbi:hypothetical protein BCh11DRAFT_06090 [Burkholderia sp. Ch1-1]|nr:hypothetical protein BCh11DRAFT_06090 [Burkholderia sp. Ch1-1]